MFGFNLSEIYFNPQFPTLLLQNILFLRPCGRYKVINIKCRVMETSSASE
jgi:hypothetical protein